jgi:hypothetical protein
MLQQVRLMKMDHSGRSSLLNAGTGLCSVYIDARETVRKTIRERDQNILRHWWRTMLEAAMGVELSPDTDSPGDISCAPLGRAC